MTRCGNGSHDGCDPLFLEIVRHTITWFVERSRRDFEQIGSPLPAHDPIQSGIVIMSPGKKLKPDGAQVILLQQTGVQAFL
jgi:hypothetical protein